MNEHPKAQPRVADIVAIVEKLAPLSLAEGWDNCGLQVGDPDWAVRKVWVALDPLPAVITAAAAQQVDLLITHHPLFFKSIKAINLKTPLGKIVETAIVGRTAVYAAHTNLDSAREGVNEVLARKIGLVDAEALIPADLPRDDDSQYRKLGLGRIGPLHSAVRLGDLAEEIKRAFNVAAVKVTGSLDKVISKVAVCSGSGGGLIEHFFQSDAELFISGDIRYHEARMIEDQGRALIDIGHFASEHIVIDALVEQLRRGVGINGYSVGIEPCRIENDPFAYI